MWPLLGFERKARLFCDNILYLHTGCIFHLVVILTDKLGFERKARLFCDGLLNRYIAYLTIVGIWAEGSVILWLKFATHRHLGSNICSLGFERKARLFCDSFFCCRFSIFRGWDLSGRLGYFVTYILIPSLPPISIPPHALGFERKARLFCDLSIKRFLQNGVHIFFVGIWAEGSVILWRVSVCFQQNICLRKK